MRKIEVTRQQRLLLAEVVHEEMGSAADALQLLERVKNKSQNILELQSWWEKRQKQYQELFELLTAYQEDTENEPEM